MKIELDDLVAWRESAVAKRVRSYLESDIKEMMEAHERAAWNERTLATPEAVNAYRAQAEGIKSADRVVFTLFGLSAPDLIEEIEAQDGK